MSGLAGAAAFVVAAILELAGCYAAWAVIRRGAHAGWLVVGLAALAVFALVLTRVDTDASGRAYAAYGGVYITLALVWLAVVDGVRPDRFDLLGAALCLAGAAVIIAAPR